MDFYQVLELSTLSSIVLMGAVYKREKQFFLTFRYLSTNPFSIGILAFEGLLLLIASYQVFINIFLGELRRWEVEECVEKLWPSVFESMIAFALFQRNLNLEFSAKFIAFLLLKFLHWAADSRVNSIENRLRPSWIHQARLCLLQGTLLTVDTGFSLYFLNEITKKGISFDSGIKLVFAYEFVILGISICFTIFKYILNVIELTQGQEIINRALYTSCVALIAEMLRCATISLFARQVMKVRHVPPIFAVRPLYRSIVKIRKTFETIIQAGIAIVRLNKLPTATAEDLDRVQGVCLICRDEMTMMPNGGRAVRIPCGHVFHFACFRSWVQRQQTCPVCRQSVFMEPVEVNPHGYTEHGQDQEQDHPNERNVSGQQTRNGPPSPRPSIEASSNHKTEVQTSSSPSCPSQAQKEPATVEQQA